MGRLIAIEGLDGSGKTTQIELLGERLRAEGIPAEIISFPDYKSDSSALVKMYLSGRFGSKPDDVDPYSASLFFAVDRYASFKTDWGKYYNGGGVVISARYTTSNAIHQASKLPESEWDAYTEWLFDTEFVKMGLPAPDLVIFLDMPPEVSQKMMSGRYSGDESKKDIHERDRGYLESCRRAALHIAESCGWQTVVCSENGAPRSKEAIAQEIYGLVSDMIKDGGNR